MRGGINAVISQSHGRRAVCVPIIEAGRHSINVRFKARFFLSGKPTAISDVTSVPEATTIHFGEPARASSSVSPLARVGGPGAGAGDAFTHTQALDKAMRRESLALRW